MFYTCSKDPSHQSTDSDYCSVCGAKISGAPSAIPPADVAATPMPGFAPSTPMGTSGGETCPDCGVARRQGARFCEVCRYNYETRTSGGIGAVAAPAPSLSPAPITIQPDIPAYSPPPAPDPQPQFAFPDVTPTRDVASVPVTDSSALPPINLSAPLAWEALVKVDPTLYTDPDPAVACPTGDPDRVFPLDLAESLIGRRSDRQDIRPEIPLADPGVSHRHAKIYRQPDGNLAILDVGSTNSTFVNGVEATVGVKVPLNEGDEITIGCWTRIIIRHASS